MPVRVLAGLLFASKLLVSGQAVRVDPRIFAGRADRERAEFLVVLREQADLSAAAAIGDRAERRRFVYEVLRAQAEAAQAPLQERLSRAGVRFRPHFLVNMLEVEGDAAMARELAAREDVGSVEANRAATLTLPGPFPPSVSRRASPDGIEPNLEKIRAPALWNRGYTGQGIVIGVADTGFQWDHPALRARYRGASGAGVSHDYAWHDAVHDAAPDNPCGSDAPAPCDDSAHGTATAGLALGDDGGENRIGAAPGATLIGCRNMDHGNGTPARYTECFEWLLAPTDSSGAHPRPELGADVINNSWTCPASEGCTDPNILRTVVENVRSAGVAVVTAAGNGGNSCSNIAEAPSIYDASVTVGATDITDRIAGFSGFGPVTIDGSDRLKPDMCAPGVNVRTSTILGAYSSTFSGTSAASPHVAGAVALLWSAVPPLAGQVDETEIALEAGAVPLTLDLDCGAYRGLDVPNAIFGWGRLDVERAYVWLTAPRERGAPVRAGTRPRTRVVRPRP